MNKIVAADIDIVAIRPNAIAFFIIFLILKPPYLDVERFPRLCFKKNFLSEILSFNTLFDTNYLDVRSSFMVTSIYSALIFVNSFVWNPFHFYYFCLFCTNSIGINCNTFFHVLFFIICRISQK